MAARQVLEVHADSRATPEEVWRLLADVTTWTTWTRFSTAEYEREGAPAPHGVGAVRRMRVGPLRSRETVVEFDAPRRLSYGYEGSLPLKDYRADVTLVEHGDGTRITWHSEFAGKLPFLGPPLKALLRRTLQELAIRLARAAEA